MRLYLSLLAVLICGLAHAQTKGSITDPAVLPNPMDPNGDGYITSTGLAFTGPLDETEFELPFVPIPAFQSEPVPDNQVPSTSCTMYELVGDPANGAESIYYYYQDPDGIPDNGDERIFFRFRIARVTNSSVGLSILIDTDHKFGSSGPDPDPNAVVGNPGFELEISVTTSTGGAVRVYNVDGLSNPSVVSSSYSVDTHLQVAYALNQDPDCSMRVPGFIDIYLPFSALGISSTTDIRMVGSSSEVTGSNLGGRASDIGGVDGNAISSDDDQFIAAIGSYPPFSFQNGANRPPSSMDGTQPLNENSPNGSGVYTVSATDPDGDVLTYAITAGNTSAAFAINSSTGAITVNNSNALDFESTPSFSLTIRISDGTLFGDAVITINLNDVNEAPSATDATVSINENSVNGTAVHTVSASDPDGDALTYAITAGNTSTAFAINSSGQISVSNATALNFETTPSFSLTIRVSDGTLFDDAVITINLNNVNEAPSATDATVSINENSVNGTAVHTVSASDPDGDALTYTITAGNTSTAFAINSSGQISVSSATALNFETTLSFSLTVKVSDGTLFDDAVITINLNDVNEAPSATDATVSINENSVNGTAVHTVSASDPDGDALTYTITAGNTSTAFAINSFGQISVSNATALNFETTPSFNLTVKVSDGTLFDDAVITINLNNVNEAPSATDATVSINENSVNGTAVHTVFASDPDGDVLTYAITAGNTSAAFAINSSTGAITVNNSNALDFESIPSFSLTIRISDGTLFDDAVITINLNDVNEAPSATDATVSINENSANGTAVHTVSASDPDGDALTYAITAGNTGTAFAINSSGQISVSNASALNFETTPSFNLIVRVSDGTLFDNAVITINLNDVNETPSAADATVFLNENLVNGTAVHTVSASDPDGDVLTYAITAGNTSAAFAINSSTGAITVNNSNALDFESTPSFSLTIRVSDGTLFDDAVITINLNDVNEAPSATDATVSINENSVNGTAVHTVSASDPDGDALTYTITAGNTAAAFVINGSGQVSVNNAAALDFEGSTSFFITVQVSDGQRFTEALVTISLRDINEPPRIGDAVIKIAKNLPNGTVVHKFHCDDPDANDTAVFSIEAGNSNSAFILNETTGELIVSNIEGFDLLPNPAFELAVMATDVGGLSATANLTIELENVEQRNVIDPLKGFSPDGDGINDFWLIKGIEAFPENEVKVFNRWGHLVFETRSYDNNEIAWRGESNGRFTVANKNVPETTYYFLITVKGLQPITGYVIKKE